MSDRGDGGNGDLFGPDPDDRDPLWGPPGREEEAGPVELPPIGQDQEPTRMMPGAPGVAGEPEPTGVMPPVPGGPFEPGYPPGGGPGGPDDPDYSEYEDGDEEVPWYRQPGPLAALIAGVIAVILLVVALIVFGGDGDDEVTDTTSTSSSTTVAPTVSAVVPPTVPPTQPPTTPPPTSPPTTVPETTTTSSTTTTTTTTTSTTTTTTTTTLPPTTAPPTTQEPARPTTTSPREPTTTIAIPDQPTAWDYVIRAPELSELEAYVRQAGMIDLFERPGLTVLAPVNQAFTDMASYEDGAALLGDNARLSVLLQRHVVVEALSAEEIFQRDSLATVGGDTLAVDGGAETIEGSSIVSADHESGDGSLIQIIDPVLVGDLLAG